MRVAGTLWRTFGGPVVVLVVTAVGVAACRSGEDVPDDVSPVKVNADVATTVNLGAGAHLIIPPGSMRDGATVRATYRGRPAADSTMRAMAPAVELIAEPADAIHGLLTLEFPVAADAANPSATFGIATYDAGSKAWQPVSTVYDSGRHMVVAQIAHFSWWNPFTWDFAGFFARVAQDFGQVTGARKGPATCHGGPPAWVNAPLAGITNEADIAIRSCLQSDGNVLDVQLVNNRPYGMVLTYGSSVKWGWHEGGSSALDKWRNSQMDAMMPRNQMYLPPLSKASVGVYPLTPGKAVAFHIGPTNESAGMDLATYILDKAVGVAPRVGKCLGLVSRPLSNLDAGALRDYATWAMGCALDGYKIAVSAGAVDSWRVEKAASVLGELKQAAKVGSAIQLAGGVTWRVGDMFFDSITNAGDLGHGFQVLAHADTSPPTGGGGTPGGGNPGGGGSSGGGGNPGGGGTPDPKPTISNFAATVVGPGHVSVTYTVGWQAGRDPVTCHFYVDGGEAYTAQCGTSSSTQFTGLSPGDHSFSAIVTDRYGVASDPSATLVRNVPPEPPHQQIILGRGPTAPAGYRYAITLQAFPANSSITVTCHDSVDPGGFYTFQMHTDGSGNAFTQSYCYSGDHPDHWVRANGLESNHVQW